MKAVVDMTATEAAVDYVMQRLTRDPDLYFEMDAFTESFDKLAAGFAEIHGVNVEEVRRQFAPPEGESRQARQRRRIEELEARVRS